MWNKREGLFNPGTWASHGIIPGKFLGSSLGASSEPLRRKFFYGKDMRLGAPEQKSQFR